MAIQEVKTRQGIVRGVEAEDYTVFKGIPYAKPPIGELRFCPPQPAEAWEGILEANHFSDICWQDKQPEGSFYEKEFYMDSQYMTPMSENCLYLNIWTPAKTADEKLPVALWIHGGAFLHGFGHEMEFDGAAYCSRSVVLVTINYRVGVFGFLAHPELTAESENHSSGNYGCLDQIMALRWVRENIGAFGGDPENITIFGQSAGAMSVQTLVSSPLTEDWISKAIMQSAGGYSNGILRDMPLQEAEQIGKRFMGFCGVSSIAQLREMSGEEFLAHQIEFLRSCGETGLQFVPNIDRYLLTEGYDAAIDHGSIKDIPFLLGSTMDDLFVDRSKLPQGIRGALYDGCIAFSQRLEQLGRKGAYVYDFRRQLPGDDAGAFHSSELWYMFGTGNRCWRPLTADDEVLSEQMLDAWTDFMRYGALANWPCCSKESPCVRIWDI